jgi:hypothetical protein
MFSVCTATGVWRGVRDGLCSAIGRFSLGETIDCCRNSSNLCIDQLSTQRKIIVSSLVDSPSSFLTTIMFQSFGFLPGKQAANSTASANAGPFKSSF